MYILSLIIEVVANNNDVAWSSAMMPQITFSNASGSMYYEVFRCSCTYMYVHVRVIYNMHAALLCLTLQCRQAR